jgi:protein phosphatase
MLKKITDSVEKPNPGIIRRLTDDHSVVMGLVAAGVISENEIRSHPLRNRITKCVGSLGDLEPDFLWYDIQEGDTLILCTDGLWEMVHEELMLAVVKSSVKPEEMCRRLISAANDAGGQDNITVITARFSAD